AKHKIGVQAAREIADFMRPIVRERMADPKPTDLVGHLALSSLDGERLSEDEVVSYTRQLLVAGAETTQRLIATTIYGILLTGVKDQVRGNEKLIESAVEEGLRWVSPAQSAIRGAAVDTELAGVPIPK